MKITINLEEKSFVGHKGRPGQVGGSAPKGAAGGGSKAPRKIEYRASKWGVDAANKARGKTISYNGDIMVVRVQQQKDSSTGKRYFEISYRSRNTKKMKFDSMRFSGNDIDGAMRWADKNIPYYLNEVTG